MAETAGFGRFNFDEQLGESALSQRGAKLLSKQVIPKGDVAANGHAMRYFREASPEMWLARQPTSPATIFGPLNARAANAPRWRL